MPEVSPKIMVIVTNYDLVENPLTGFFLFGVRNLYLVHVVEKILE